MRTLLSIFIFISLTSCNNLSTEGIKDQHKKILTTDTIKTITTKNIVVSLDTTGVPKSTLKSYSVLVLPPYDEIANAGISPDIQKYLEVEISKDTSLNLIKFPFEKLMNVPYYNIFDKKFCKPILKKVKADIIVMSKLNQVTRTGNMTTDKWNFKIKIYNTNTGKQLNSNVKADSLTNNEIKNALAESHINLVREIKFNR